MMQASQRAEAHDGAEEVVNEDGVTTVSKEACRLLAKDKERGGVPGFDCSVCINRPIQVTELSPLWRPA